MFVTNERAMVLGNKLIIADVHLGITLEIYKSGVSLPSQVVHFFNHSGRLVQIFLKM